MNKRALLVLVSLLATLLPASESAAQTDPVYTFNGSGWGHGVGMSQYGARSLAAQGKNANEIINTYYAGVTINGMDAVLDPAHWMRSDPDPLWIGLGQNKSVLPFHVEGGSVGLCKANDGEGECPTQTANPGENWEFRTLGGGACQFFLEGAAVGNPGTCRATIEWELQPDTKVHLPSLAREYARGTIRIRPVGSNFHVILEVPVEDYLYGLGEMPSTWPAAALQAQAIAARTYGVRQALKWGPESTFSGSRRSQCWCQLYSTTVDQSYVGWLKEQSFQGDKWVAAVDATAGQLVTHPQAPDSTVIIAYYSSSSGGHTDSNIAGLGHTTLLPYTPGIPDPWSVDSLAQNPFASWSKDVSASTIAAAVGLDTVTGVAVTGQNASGSVSQVAISGLVGGVEHTINRSGRSFKSSLGLRSLFYSIVPPDGSVIPQPGVALCSEPSPTSGFTDISGSVHEADIDCMAALGIMGASNGLFEPTTSVRRWQMALYMVRTAEAAGIALPDGFNQGFTDLGGLPTDVIFAINQLRQLGLTRGVSDTLYDPQGVVPRWQMAIFLTRLHGTFGFELPAGAHGFTDMGDYSAEADTAVGQLFSLGITKGTSDTTFGPSQEVTKEQMASFLARLLRLDT